MPPSGLLDRNKEDRDRDEALAYLHSATHAVHWSTCGSILFEQGSKLGVPEPNSSCGKIKDPDKKLVRDVEKQASGVHPQA